MADYDITVATEHTMRITASTVNEAIDIGMDSDIDINGDKTNGPVLIDVKKVSDGD